MPELYGIVSAMFLGFVSYGLSIYFYVKAQNILGAAKTSAYYSASPFIGALMSFVLLNEEISGRYLSALIVMIAGSILVVMDTLRYRHEHKHIHILGNNMVISHSHVHSHYINLEKHVHFHA